jgi:Transposase DDE domain
MSSQRKYTAPEVTEQAAKLINQEWEEQVVKQLPRDAEEQAFRLKAFVRCREIKSVGDLLRGLLAYVLCVSSFRQLGSWAVLLGLANISDSAWRKRLKAANAWLLWLLSALLCGPAAPVERASPSGLGRIILVDGTRLKQMGGTGDDWRVHSAYDLRESRLIQVHVTDKHTAESLQHFQLQRFDLLIADRGYGYRKNIAYAYQQQAYVILRFVPSTCPLVDRYGQPLDIVKWLKQVKKGKHCRNAWCVYEGKKYHVRIIASALPPEKAAEARKKREQEAKKKGRQLQPDTLFLVGWTLLITNLPKRPWSYKHILQLYRARWQIELLFKRMKQMMDMHVIRSKTPQGCESSLLAWFIIWVLQEQEVQEARTILQQVHQCLDSPVLDIETGELSPWLFTSICFQTILITIQGHWTRSRLDLCLPYLQRFLYGSPRRRRLQSHQVCALLGKLAPISSV